MRIKKEFKFEASHILPRHPGKCSRLHGHSWRLWVTVEGLVNRDTGFVVDFFDLKKTVNQLVIDRVDHTHLGFGSAVTPDSQFMPSTVIYPTSENLVWLFSQWLAVPLANSNLVTLVELELSETCTSSAIWQNGDN